MILFRSVLNTFDCLVQRDAWNAFRDVLLDILECEAHKISTFQEHFCPSSDVRHPHYLYTHTRTQTHTCTHTVIQQEQFGTADVLITKECAHRDSTQCTIVVLT